jgi:hypothetical protein
LGHWWLKIPGPQSFPLDVSDKPFEIHYNDDLDNVISPGSTEKNSLRNYLIIFCQSSKI